MLEAEIPVHIILVKWMENSYDKRYQLYTGDFIAMNGIKQLFETAKTTMEQHRDFVFVTIIASSGSSPRGAGCRMLVMDDGTAYGTIGGGNVEYQSIQQAKEVLLQKQSFTKGYKLRKDQIADLGMICGGDVMVYFQYISYSNQSFYQLCSQLLADWDQSENCWLIMDITNETAWSAGFYREPKGMYGLSIDDPTPLLQSKAIQVTIKDRRYYSEPLIRAGIVYIFGGGHVAQELVPILTHLDFRCVVFDDRPEFANPDVFPDASRCIIGDFERISDFITIQPSDYLCIMTRGHHYDYLVQKQSLLTSAYYIGVMGSRHKKAMIREKLLADGFTDIQIARFQTPIGLPISAETPAEIAISIAGELIQWRAKKQSL